MWDARKKGDGSTRVSHSKQNGPHRKHIWIPLIVDFIDLWYYLEIIKMFILTFIIWESDRKSCWQRMKLKTLQTLWNFWLFKVILNYLCHAPNPKGSKAWEKHLKGTRRFFLFDNSIQIIHIKYQHLELS